jgi:hypothetical protein
MQALIFLSSLRAPLLAKAVTFHDVRFSDVDKNRFQCCLVHGFHLIRLVPKRFREVQISLREGF